MHKTMRKSAVLKGAVAGIASIAMLMSVSVTANAADTLSPGSAVKPNITLLLGEYYNWWTPKKVVNNTPQGDAFRGKVTDAGKSVLGQNDKTVVAINNKAAADTTKVDGTYTQAERAALDASDGDALRIYKDAFGPIIGQYVAEGVAQGELPKTSDLVFSKSSKDSFAGFVGTGSAKKDFNYPRPYFNKENEGVDRTIGGDTDLNGLSPTLDIKRIPMINIDGQEYGEDYTDYQEPVAVLPVRPHHQDLQPRSGIGHAAARARTGTRGPRRRRRQQPCRARRALPDGRDRRTHLRQCIRHRSVV